MNRSDFKIPDRAEYQGAGRRKSGAYIEYVSILRRSATPRFGVRWDFETTSRKVPISLFLGLLIPLGLFVLMLGGCKTEKPRPSLPLERLKPSVYPKFTDDLDYRGLTAAITESLKYLRKIPPDRPLTFGGDAFSAARVANSLEFFLEFIKIRPGVDELNEFIARNYRVYRSTGRNQAREVLFTGYYEPLLKGCLAPAEKCRYPVYSRPQDLVSIDLSLFSEKFKDERLVGRYTGTTVVPYYERRQIDESEVLNGKVEPIAWVDDPVGLFFLHIQGSGKIALGDGQTINVHYHGTNGQPYRSIGQLLIDDQKISREEMSMQAIRAYLEAHPEQIRAVFNHNPSYIFFKIEPQGALGYLNVPLTAARSIATDRRLFPPAALAFIETEKPLVDDLGKITAWSSFSRFVLNQDTGGAIKGPGRVDLFWGSGDYAELAAGHLKHPGRLYFLVLEPGSGDP